MSLLWKNERKIRVGEEWCTWDVWGIRTVLVLVPVKFLLVVITLVFYEILIPSNENGCGTAQHAISYRILDLISAMRLQKFSGWAPYRNLFLRLYVRVTLKYYISAETTKSKCRNCDGPVSPFLQRDCFSFRCFNALRLSMFLRSKHSRRPSCCGVSTQGPTTERVSPSNISKESATKTSFSFKTE